MHSHFSHWHNKGAYGQYIHCVSSVSWVHSAHSSIEALMQCAMFIAHCSFNQIFGKWELSFDFHYHSFSIFHRMTTTTYQLFECIVIKLTMCTCDAPFCTHDRSFDFLLHNSQYLTLNFSLKILYTISERFFAG